MNRGYIKLFRKIEDSVSWSRGADYRGLMASILIKASRKKTAFRGTEIKPGQFAVVMSSWCDEMKLERKKLKRMLDNLNLDNFIKLQNVSNRFTVVSVVNWGGYQVESGSSCPTTGQPVSNHRATVGQPMDNQRSADGTTDDQPPGNQCPTTGQPIEQEREKKRRREERESSGDDGSPSSPAEDDSPGVPNCPYDDIVAAFNRILPMLPRVKVISPKRKKALRSLWRAHEVRQSIEWWEAYFQLVAECSFLHGRNKRDFTAGFDWLTNPNNMIKTLEGNYRDKAKPQPEDDSQADFEDQVAKLREGRD